MNLEDRIAILVENGFIHDERTRNFTNGGNKIDVDIVEYGTDQLFEKHLKKFKIEKK